MPDRMHEQAARDPVTTPLPPGEDMPTCLTCGAELEHTEALCAACERVAEPGDTSLDATDVEPAAATDFEFDTPSAAQSLSAARQTRVKPAAGAQTLLLAVFAFFMMMDLLTFPILIGLQGLAGSSMFVAFSVNSMLMAIVVAQFVLMAIWWVFAPVSLLRRAACGIPAPLIWCASYFAGFLLAVPDGGTSVYILVAVAYVMGGLPLLMIASQLLLWCARFWLRWRIVRVEPTSAIQGYQPLRILDVMIATGAVAVALTLAKLGNIGGSRSDAEYLMGFSITAGIGMIVVAALALPCLWVGLRRPAPAGGKLIAAGVHVAIVIITMVVGMLIEGRGMPPAEVWGAFFMMAAFHWAIMMLILCRCRRCGYALHWKAE